MENVVDVSFKWEGGSGIGVSYDEVGFVATQKFTREIPANIPQAGFRNAARYIGRIREFRFGARTHDRRMAISMRAAPDFARHWGTTKPPRLTR